ncbi:hypothetical protein QA640_36530 [Bradyrhizobium sp. CB82]|uniref:hypothetical protein n=1 Tax=Bradyrhizobium sp. CB82 TaxID=3039159 RepID=UPI0024B14FE9|nr:hypothetical protein [Bradyrhizobium sp. CB82]WFU39793.1 hypothetical protein QA640_36530 [Bradyrhizobium sp. CB82]
MGDALLTHEEFGNAYEIVGKLVDENSNLRGIFVNHGGTFGDLRARRELSSRWIRKQSQRSYKLTLRTIQALSNICANDVSVDAEPV